MFGPPLLIGDRVLYRSDNGKLLDGTVRWLGRLTADFGQQMVVGVELVRRMYYIIDPKFTISNITLFARIT